MGLLWNIKGFFWCVAVHSKAVKALSDRHIKETAELQITHAKIVDDFNAQQKEQTIKFTNLQMEFNKKITTIQSGSKGLNDKLATIQCVHAKAVQEMLAQNMKTEQHRHSQMSAPQWFYIGKILQHWRLRKLRQSSRRNTQKQRQTTRNESQSFKDR